jgi:drug/metabolite transporter (DMT)-like permease
MTDGRVMDGRADRTFLAAALIVGAVVLLSGADAVVKRLATDYSVWQIYTARSVFSVAILFGLLAMGGVRQLSGVKRPWVVCRSLLFVAMWIAYYAALPSIELSVAATGIYTAPLFMALFSSLLAGDPVGRDRWIGVAGGFLGVLVILRPAAEDFSLLTLLPVLAAVFYALAAIVTRTRCADENPLVLALALHLGLLIAGLIGSMAIILIEPIPTDRFLLGAWSPMEARDWLIMAALGIVMVVVAVGVAKAYQSGPSAVVGTFDYAYLVFATLWGALFFAETPDLFTAAGILLIVGSGILVLTRSRKASALAPAFEKT